MLVIKGQFSYGKAKTRRIAGKIKITEYNESDISLDFDVVFGVKRPKAIISFVRSEDGFHLT